MKVNKQALESLVNRRMTCLNRDECYKFTGKFIDNRYDSVYEYVDIIFWRDVLDLFKQCKSSHAEKCPICNGEGQLTGIRTCYGCDGKGWVTVYD